MKLLSRLFFVNFVLLISGLNTYPQVYKVIESGADHIIIEFNFGNSYTVVDTTVDGRTYQKIQGEDHSMRNPVIHGCLSLRLLLEYLLIANLLLK